jgi:hypothetical protein
MQARVQHPLSNPVTTGYQSVYQQLARINVERCVTTALAQGKSQMKSRLMERVFPIMHLAVDPNPFSTPDFCSCS